LIDRIVTSLRYRAGAGVSRALARRPALLRCDPPVVSFTFDDVPRSAVATGAELLEQRDARGSYYVSAGRLGQSGSGERILDAADVTALAGRGHEIGCHTFAHARPGGRHEPEIEADLDENARALAGILPGLRLSSFAYPFGDVTLALKRAAGRRFATCRVIRGGVNAGRVDLALLRATPIYGATIDPAGLDARLDEADARRGWLVFYTHDVRENPSAHGCTPEVLARTLDAVLARGFRVLPVREALELARAD